MSPTPAQELEFARGILNRLREYGDKRPQEECRLTSLLVQEPELLTEDGERALGLLAELGYIRVFEEDLEDTDSDYRDFRFYIDRVSAALDHHCGSFDALSDSERGKVMATLQWPFSPVIRITGTGLRALDDYRIWGGAPPIPDNIFRFRGTIWEVRHRGKPDGPLPIQRSVGMIYIWSILRQPTEKPVSSLSIKRIADCAQAPARSGPDKVVAGQEDAEKAASVRGGINVDDAIDSETIQDVRRRMGELLEERRVLESSERQDDPAAQAELEDVQRELDLLFAYLQKSQGFRSHSKTLAATDTKRAADAVRVGLQRAYKDIRKAGLPALADWLDRSIHPGYDVIYRPTPPIEWELV